MCKSDLSKHRANPAYMELSTTNRQLLDLPEIPEIKQTILSVKDDTEFTINKSWFIEFGGKVFIRDVNTPGETIYKDTKGTGLLDITDDGVRSFCGRNFRIYFHKNGNHNYIHKENGLLFNEENGFPNGVKKILTTINHDTEGRLLEFTFIDNGIEGTHYLSETGKILDESFNRLDGSDPYLDKLF